VLPDRVRRQAVLGGQLGSSARTAFERCHDPSAGRLEKAGFSHVFKGIIVKVAKIININIDYLGLPAYNSMERPWFSVPF